jgi:hypothetical protein
MNKLLKCKFSGMTLGKWIECLPNDLAVDAVALFHVIVGLRRSFDLDSEALDEAVRETLEGLMATGARPIQGHSDDGGYWTRVTRFGDDPAGIVDGVIAEWHAAGKDPDIGDIWFASPAYIAAECRDQHLTGRQG